jgi:hypothetical protein
LPLISLQDARDWAIIVSAVVGTITFLTIFIVTFVSGFLTWGILRRVRSILKDNVQPAATNVKETAQNIRGTVSYISDTAVRPVVTAYGVAAGARRFVGVVTRVAGRKKEKG